MEEHYRPLSDIQEALHYWWVVILLMVIGAVAGFIIHRVQPPLYEARRELYVNLDFVRTGRVTDQQIDTVLVMVGDRMFSEELLAQVTKQAQKQGIEMDTRTFSEIATLERQNYVWLMMVRHPDPQVAASLVNLWAEVSCQFLDEIRLHATIADNLMSYADYMESCLQAVVSEPAHAFCSTENLSEILAEMQQTNQVIQEEKDASYGMSSAMSYSLSDPTSPPAEPIRFGKNLMVFAGALVGLIAALWVIHFNLPSTFFKKALHHA